MADLNHFILIGRLTKDAAQPAGDRGPVKITLAVNRRVKHGDQWSEEASFFDLDYWHRSILPFLVKGKQVAVQGEFKQDRWEQDGQPRSKIALVANNIQLLGGGQREAQQGQSKESRTVPQQNTAKASSGTAESFGDDTFTDDIPFSRGPTF